VRNTLEPDLDNASEGKHRFSPVLRPSPEFLCWLHANRKGAKLNANPQFFIVYREGG
jgi:hypothetical protein